MKSFEITAKLADQFPELTTYQLVVISEYVSTNYADGWVGGAEARSHQINNLLLGIVLQHLSDKNIQSVMAELDQLISSLPLPEPPKEG